MATCEECEPPFLKKLQGYLLTKVGFGILVCVGAFTAPSHSFVMWRVLILSETHFIEL